MLTAIAIWIGASAGALARWQLGLWLNQPTALLPWGTLAANWSGAWLVGLAVVFFQSQPQLDPAWRLAVALEPSRRPLGRRIDDTAARYELTLVGDWSLTPMAGGEALTGQETVPVTYAAADQPYAASAAQQDAEDRAAEALAQRIRLALVRAMGPTAPARP